MNADAEEALEISKISKKENRVYVGNLSYDVKYGDLMEFMRGGGWSDGLFNFRCGGSSSRSRRGRANAFVQWLWLALPLYGVFVLAFRRLDMRFRGSGGGAGRGFWFFGFFCSADVEVVIRANC